MSGSLPPSPAAEEGRLWAAPASGQPGPTRGATEALTQRPRLLHSLRSEPPLLQPPSLLSRRSQQCPAGALRQLPVNQGTAGRGSGPVSRGWGARGGVCVGGWRHSGSCSSAKVSAKRARLSHLASCCPKHASCCARSRALREKEMGRAGSLTVMLPSLELWKGWNHSWSLCGRLPVAGVHRELTLM